MAGIGRERRLPRRAGPTDARRPVDIHLEGVSVLACLCQDATDAATLPGRNVDRANARRRPAVAEDVAPAMARRNAGEF